MNSQISQYFLGESTVSKASMKGRPQEQEKGKLMLLVYTVEILFKVGNIRQMQDALKIL